MALLDYAWLIPALPLAAAAVIALVGLRTPEKGGWIAVLLVGLAGALSLGVFYDALRTTPVTWEKPFLGTPGTPANFNWFTVGDLKIDMGVYLDPLTIFMLFTVGILVTLIALYSVGYMHDEGPGRRRYFAELTLFITGMLGLVVSNNYLMLFVFWEIMGLCSYLLIGYWYAKPSAASAAKKAFLTTRVGDAFFLVGLGILFTQFHTLNFNELFDAAAKGAPGIDRNVLLLANSCVFIGAVGKSAQFPLHTWLPDAMEGPTTVSALIHAATMVKAGVYLVARSYPLFVLTPQLLVAVAIIGGFTALFAASLALTNWDLKRVLAYSTLSQLGYMFLGLGVAGALYWSNGGKDAALVALALTGVTVAIFHLFSHAFFKAGLFLSAGSVGHSFHGASNPYDMRQMGGLRKYMPITTFAMLMGCISIAGIPPFSGFFSKDAIIGAVWKAARATSGTGALVYYALYAAAVLTAGLTAYYMFRLYFLTFEGRHRGVDWAVEKGLVTPAPAAVVPEARLGADARARASSAHDVGTPSTMAHADPHMHGHAGPAAPPAMHDADDHHDAGGHDAHAEPHECPWTMTVPLVILGVFAIFGGIIALSFASGSFNGLIHASEGTVAAAGGAAPEEHLTLASAIIEPFLDPMTYVTLVAAILGIALAWTRFGPSKAESSLVADAEARGLARVWQKRYHVDQLYDTVFGRWVLRTAAVEDAFDREVIDGAVNGVATVNDRAAGGIRKWNTGFVQDYALTMLAGLVLIVLIAIYAPQIPDIWSNYVAPYLPGGR